MLERFPGKSPETHSVSREEVIAAIERGGPQDAEAEKLLNAWLDQQEARRDKGEITDGEHNREWIQLYLDAGLTSIAVEECQNILHSFGIDPEYDDDDFPEDMLQLFAFCEEVIKDTPIN